MDFFIPAAWRKNLCAFLAVVALFSAPAGQAAAAPCPSDVDESQFDLDYAEFDAAGWRNLLAKGCADAAVALLEGYRTANEGKLSGAALRELPFHAGQALALSGRDEESIPHFEAARGGDEEWAAYVEATIAFLKREKEALSAQRERYARAPNAGAMRLSFIDGFIKCPDRSYSQAVHCAMSH